MVVDVALANAEKLYSFFLDHEDFFEEIQMQFVPVERMPDWILPENQSEKCIGLRENGREDGVCLILEEDMDTTLNNLISGSGKLIVYEVDSIRDMTGICFCNFSGKRFLRLYKSLFSIAKNLGICVPAVLFVNPEEFEFNNSNSDGAITEGDSLRVYEKGTYIGSYIRIVKQGFVQMLRVLSHEMRHVWQAETDLDGYFTNYKTGEVLGYSYSLQMAEVDAVAYSVLYMDSLGYDGMHQVFGFDYKDAYRAPKENADFIQQIAMVTKYMPSLKNSFEKAC